MGLVVPKGIGGWHENPKEILWQILHTTSDFDVSAKTPSAVFMGLGVRRDVGVDMQIQLIDGTAISSFWFEGRFDAMLHWWHMPADPEITLFFAGDRAPPAGRNINYFADARLTTLLYASDRTVDRQERRHLLHEAQRAIADLVPEIPLYNVTRLDVVPSNLANFKGNPTNTGIFWNVHEWEIR